MKFKQTIGIAALLLGFCASAAYAQDSKISGYMFGDYYWFAKDHNSAIQDQNGFWLRRVYFTYDKKLSDAFSTRLRLEMAHPDGISKSTGTAAPFIKDAYMKWKKGQTQILLGISSTPTWNVVEKFWGYRAVEKTPLDLQKFGSSRDFGVAFKGNLGQSGKAKYHFMLGNGNSNKTENNKGKKAALSLGFYPSKKVTFEIYGDWIDNPGATNWLTVQGFLGIKAEKARFGLQFAHQTRKSASGDDLNLQIGSAFVVIKTSEKVNLFARIDRMFDPNPKGSKISYIPFASNAKSTFFLGGVEFLPIKQVHLMPNIEVVVYDGATGDNNPDADVIPRFTFYYQF